MSAIIEPFAISSQSIVSLSSSPFTHSKGSEANLKQDLIKQIATQLEVNQNLQARQETLQNTVYDLRKLIEVSNKEGQETVEYLHSQIQKIQVKKEQYRAVLNYVKGNNSHLQKCMLFWTVLA